MTTYRPLSRGDAIFIAGHGGLAGSAVLRKLQASGYGRLWTKPRSELDLKDRDAVRRFLEAIRPDAVFLCAAKVGGILANDEQRVDFLLDNLKIQTNVLEACSDFGVRLAVFLGSSCIYPRDCRQPIKETDLLSGRLELTNRPYAIAKIAGIELVNALNEQRGCRYFSVMPTNLYGPGDNFHPSHSHVLPALIRRFHEAKIAGLPEVTAWGSGSPRREFMHSDDFASAVTYLAEHLDESWFKACAASPDRHYFLNVGSGEEVSIRDLTMQVAKATGYAGRVVFDASKPDGTPRKALDSSRLRDLGWSPSIDLARGIAETYRWFLDHRDTLREV